MTNRRYQAEILLLSKNGCLNSGMCFSNKASGTRKSIVLFLTLSLQSTDMRVQGCTRKRSRATDGTSERYRSLTKPIWKVLETANQLSGVRSYICDSHPISYVVRYILYFLSPNLLSGSYIPYSPKNILQNYSSSLSSLLTIPGLALPCIAFIV